MIEQPLSRWPWRLPPAPPSMALIAADVARSHGLTVADLKNRAKLRRISWARQEAWAAMNEAGFTHTQAVRFLGFKDHTSSVYACSAVAERRAQNRTISDAGTYPKERLEERADKHLSALARALAQQERAA